MNMDPYFSNFIISKELEATFGFLIKIETKFDLGEEDYEVLNHCKENEDLADYKGWN